MTLNFVLGTNQFDHHKKMMELFNEDYKKDPQGQFFFLVPNHIKFESEVNILKEIGEFKDVAKDKVIATDNVQTFSFSRLAWYFLRSNKDFNAETLTQTKAAMLLKNIVQENKSELKIFAGMIDKPGFIDQMISQFNEFLNGQVQPDDIEQVLSNEQTDIFADKITELNKIYTKYLEVIQTFNTNDFQLNALADFLNKKIGTSHYHFYIEGFSNFTATELNLVKAMIINSNNLNISLVASRDALNSNDKNGFFYRPIYTYTQLRDFVKQEKISTHNFFADELRVGAELADLEDFWIKSSDGIPTKKQTLENNTAVQIWRATDKQTEVSAVSSYIRRMVSIGSTNKDGKVTRKYRFKDFLIVTRNLSEYSSFIESFMNSNDVPYFIDLQKKMANHPFKRLIDLLFNIHDKGMQEDDVISLLRTELLIPEEFDQDIIAFRQALDLTENYALTNGITKRDWLGEAFKPYATLDPIQDKVRIQEYKQINLIKEFVKNIYQQLDKFLNKELDSTAGATALYNFLNVNKVFDVLLQWQKTATDQKNLSLANQPQQIVTLFNQILDEYVTVFGEQKFNSDEFISILDAAFESATYSQIPSTLDAVSISEIGMIQPNNRKITFILGSTTANMPGATVSNDLITDDERSFLNTNLNDGKFLNDSDEVVNNAEPFLHDLIFTTSSEKLIFTYPNLTEDNKELDLSNYVKRIQEHFDLTIEDKLASPLVDDSDDDPQYNQVLEYVGSKDSTLNYLIKVSRSAQDQGTDIPNPWNYVKAKLLQRNSKQTDLEQTPTEFALESLTHKNNPVDLSMETVDKLYGKNINVSISQLETFYQNEYEYFLKYGLRLRKRQLFEITPAQTGSIFHAVLDGLVKYLNSTNPARKLADFDDQEIHDLIHDLFEAEAQLPENKIFNSSDRMKYISDKLQSTLIQLVKNMKLQYGHNEFVPKRSEVSFGHMSGDTDLPGLTFPISEKHNINVRGKIDRIDQMTLDNLTYLAIIDYKSSETKFDFAKFLNGLTMQMPTYIDDLQTNQSLFEDGNQPIKVGGALYEHIVNPFIRLTKVKTPLQQQIMSKFKLTGILLDDEELLDNFDITARTSKKVRSQSSPVVNFGNNEVIDSDQLADIIEYNRNLILNAGKKIYSGKLALNPFRFKKTTALQYSDYRAIFEFDAMLPENDYHDIINYNKDDVLKKISDNLGVIEDD